MPSLRIGLLWSPAGPLVNFPSGDEMRKQATARQEGRRALSRTSDYGMIGMLISIAAYRNNQESLKTGNPKPFDAIEKLVTGQMWAKIFPAKSLQRLFRQAPREEETGWPKQT